MKAILTYHSIDDSGSVISVDRATFSAHVHWLARHVAIVPLEDIVTASEANTVALTFDDGFQNFADAALPLLREHGMPATVFVATDHVGHTNRWSAGTVPVVPELPLMSWDVLGRLGEHGITVGSHTRTHPNLRRTSKARLDAEIREAADVINSELGRRPATFAYPYGEFDDASVKLARSTYALACTTELRAVDAADDCLLLPRLDAYYFRRAGVLEQFGTPSFRRFLWVRRHGRAARRAFTRAGGRA
jgi:peptidoglycan/xylan/chitin deacetylase (PgdA/CDA1 family)